ncbi:MAG: SUMF1/EgtB/PvdO family nonheme iron enzyme [candidate division KSB1 bacterium]|nr:SUMF1/EgtB/PvdO family nonheme iron enzyme [candidate division KSB1 bacterium]MDZ7274991.1 SUMF1/EgtB/PvdO family nonheme iron enzyme [candidate division KSB1 bacterium]MDZ7286558.1 SUMF1/EgtB/PvdO family nonheme iron enzyme [candidate division KSB1 bacterium]MDZ7299278.1 SUMF1/EgtB/PvdO family nonheme iron enzyme [candidate division KSB1 bacterium]MDZ7306062.1 SUMF1/EgtB/PvdO family nonheme iron enzyme [candidate division KSB1 bacterium]
MKTTIKTCTKCQSPYDAGLPHVCAGVRASGSLQAHPRPQIGMVIDRRYQLHARLGEGGMGSVFRARRMFIEDFVAIKFIRPDFLSNAEIRQRFYQEAQVAARIKHPNVVSVYDFGETADGLVYFVMEFLEGMSLGQRLSRHGPLPLDRVLELGTQICAALSCMLANNVIHRDLKPDNIMLVKDEHGNEMVKVVDFGVAKILESNARLTRYQARIGSPVYSSPEQYLGQPVDHRTDLYSLGVIFYESLTGQLPFDALNESELINAIVNKIPPRLDEILTGFPVGMADLVQQLLAKNPADRPASAAEVGRRLQRLRQGALGQQVFRLNRKAERRAALVAGAATAASPIPTGVDVASPHADNSPLAATPAPGRKSAGGNGTSKPAAGRRASRLPRAAQSTLLRQSLFITAVFLVAASLLSWAILREPATQNFLSEAMRRLLARANHFVEAGNKNTAPAGSPGRMSAPAPPAQSVAAAPAGSTEVAAASKPAGRQVAAAVENQNSAPPVSPPATRPPEKEVANGAASSNNILPRPRNGPPRNLLVSRQAFRTSETPAEERTTVRIPEGMVLVQPGAWRRAGTAGTPQTAALGDFIIGKYEVTNREYLAFVEATGKHFPEWMDAGSKYHYLTGSDGFYKQLGPALHDPDHPVVGVSWEDAVEYCNWLSQNRPEKYRLPTEAEWEFAARSGGMDTKYSWGNGPPQLTRGGNVADEALKKVFPDWPVIWRNYDDRHAFTAPVGKFGANALGIYDMTGNVWEWCSGWFATANGPAQNGVPVPLGNERVIRGGSWSDTPARLQISYRRGIAPSFRSNNLGFRVAASWPP